MYFKVEPTGCSERKGLVQVRYDCCLDKEDHGYKEACNPFYSHFCQFSPEEATDENIMFVGELALKMAYEKWEKGASPAVQNQPVKIDLSASRKAVCIARVEQIKAATFEKQVK